MASAKELTAEIRVKSWSSGLKRRISAWIKRSKALVKAREEEKMDTFGDFQEGDWTKKEGGEVCRVLPEKEYQKWLWDHGLPQGREIVPGAIPVVFPDREITPVCQVWLSDLIPVEVHIRGWRSGQIALHSEYGRVHVLTWEEFGIAKDDEARETIACRAYVPVGLANCSIKKRVAPDSLSKFYKGGILDDEKAAKIMDRIIKRRGGILTGPVESTCGTKINGKDVPEAVIPLKGRKLTAVTFKDGTKFKLKSLTLREVENIKEGLGLPVSIGFGAKGSEEIVGGAELTDVSLVPAEKAMEHCRVVSREDHPELYEDGKALGGYLMPPEVAEEVWEFLHNGCTCRAGKGEDHRADCPRSVKIGTQTKEDLRRIARQDALDELESQPWEHPSTYSPPGLVWPTQADLEARKEKYHRELPPERDPLDEFMEAFRPIKEG